MAVSPGWDYQNGDWRQEVCVDIDEIHANPCNFHDQAPRDDAQTLGRACGKAIAGSTWLVYSSE